MPEKLSRRASHLIRLSIQAAPQLTQQPRPRSTIQRCCETAAPTFKAASTNAALKIDNGRQRIGLDSPRHRDPFVDRSGNTSSRDNQVSECASNIDVAGSVARR